MNLDALLSTTVARGASDLHLKVGSFPHLRINGDLVPLSELGRVTIDDAVRMVTSILSDPQKQRFHDTFEADIGYGVSGLGRFRVSVFQQRGSVALAARVIPFEVPGFESLHLPRVLEKIAREPRGLVLVTGTTGSGKSTTLAAMVDFINARLTRHIITIEDPIEFLHGDRRSMVSQREVSVDTSTFASALRGALRQDPDIILVGEMRDLDTIETALLAAETGHLVLSTLHTIDAVETIQRIIAVFPSRQQQQVRLQLGLVLRAVISMRLIKRTDHPGRVPATEVMVSTEYIRGCIHDPDKTRLIRQAIALGTSQYGMQTFDQSLYEHYQAGRVSYHDALYYATNPDDLKLKIEGVYSTADAARQVVAKELAEHEP